MKLEDLGQHGLVYLATPYSKYPSHGIFSGISSAYIEACQVAGKLIKRGLFNVYCPIAESHSIAIYSAINPMDYNIWAKFDKFKIDKSDAIVVAMMPTWQVSVGIKKEIEVFQGQNKPVYYLDPTTLELTPQPVSS